MNLTHQQIRNALLERLPDYPETCRAGTRATTIVQLDTFTVRCQPSQEAIRKCADKFAKPLTLRQQHGREGYYNDMSIPSIANGSTKRTFKEMILEGDYQGAVDLWSLRHTVYFSEDKIAGPVPIFDASPVDGYPDFVVGKPVGRKWNVIHLPSGFTAGSEANTKKAAIAKFTAIPAEKLEAAIASVKVTDFQRQAAVKYGL